MSPRVSMTLEVWRSEANRRFGADKSEWAFVCPCCGYRQAFWECVDAGMPVESIGFSCIGRWSGPVRRAFGDSGPGPCDYAGGGLFNVNPFSVTVGTETMTCFAFAEPGVPATGGH